MQLQQFTWHRQKHPITPKTIIKTLRLLHEVNIQSRGPRGYFSEADAEKIVEIRKTVEESDAAQPEA